jgi:hypothetical protein
MTFEEATAAAGRFSAEHPERDTHTWIPREASAGEWEVVKVRVPAGVRRDPLKATTEAKPKPSEAEDPRPAIFRNIPPYGAA